MAAGSGTSKSGFMTAENGPFRCSNCKFWRGPVGCVQSDVVADPEVPKVSNAQGVVMGQARADDCCSYFTSLRSVVDVHFDDVGL